MIFESYCFLFASRAKSLIQLVDTKDVDNVETLLHLLVKQMMEIKGGYSQFPMNDFMHIVKASRVNPEETAKGVTAIKSSVAKVRFSIIFVFILCCLAYKLSKTVHLRHF